MQRKYLYRLALLAGLLFAGAKVWADEDRDASEIESLSGRVAVLEKNLPIKIGLLLQVQYVHNSVGALTGEYDQFLGKRGEIKLYGDLLPRKVSFAAVLDPIAKPTSPMKDYYAKVSTLSYADAQFGQFKYPQGLEARQPSGDLDHVNRALVSSAFGDKRDIALQISGSGLALGPLSEDYALALVQGAGQNNPENNNDKDLAGRVGVQWEGLWAGLTGYAGWEPTGLRNNIGLEARWAYQGVKLQAEYLQGELEPGNAANPIPAAQKAQSFPQGYYALANYRFGDFRLGLRWESFNPDVTAGSIYNTPSDVLTLGADWFQDQDHFRFYLDFEEHYRQYESLLAQWEVYL